MAHQHIDPSTEAEEDAMAAMGSVAEVVPTVEPTGYPPTRNGPTPGSEMPVTVEELPADSSMAMDTSAILPYIVTPPDSSLAETCADPETQSEGQCRSILLTNQTEHAEDQTESMCTPMQIDEPAAATNAPTDGALADLQGEVSTSGSQVGATSCERLQPYAPVVVDADKPGVSRDDPIIQHVANVNEAMHALELSASQTELLNALKTVLKILSNSLQHPGNERYASVRRSNSTFSRSVAAWPPAERLLQLAGFSLVQDERWTLGKRQDPGMLWLVSDLIQQRVAQFAM